MSDIKDRFAEIIGRSAVTPISLVKVLGIHPAVCRSLIDAYPCRLDDQRRLDPVTVCWLLMTMPLVVVESTSKKDGYWVIGGFYTWQLLSSARAASSQSKRKQQEGHLPETVHAVKVSGELQKATIERMAACDTWLRMVALPVPTVADAVFVRLHALVGTALLKVITPGLSSVRKLAAYLGHKSHTAIAKLAFKEEATGTEVPNGEGDDDTA